MSGNLPLASSEAGPSSSKLQKDNEDPRVFDFLPFYKQQEFCDRIIRLEILRDNSSSNVVDSAADERCTSTEIVAGEEEATALDTQENMEDSRDGGKRIIGRKRQRVMEEPGSLDQSRCASPASFEGQEEPREVAEGQENGAESLSEEETPSRRSERQIIREALKKRKSQLEEALICAAKDDGWEGNQQADEAEEISISAAVVAAKSDVLKTMMLSEMKESKRDAPIVLKVTRQEKAAVLEMLRFIYAGRLSDRLLDPATPVSQLVDLVLAGDKFGVGSLLTSITPALRQRLDNVAVVESILREIPDAILLGREFVNVITDARKVLLGRFKRVADWASCSEFLALSQKGVELLLESEELEAADEEQVFGAVVTWVSSNLDGLASKREAMRSLAPSIRFGRMRGEFLEREVLRMPEMQLVEVEALVREALSFQAWSDEEKLRMCTAKRFQERRGIAESNVEFLFIAEVDDVCSSEESRIVRWGKRAWWVRLTMSGDSTVGVYLHSSTGYDGGSEQRTDRINAAFYARSWPSGHWECLAVGRPAVCCEGVWP